jgi:hypothetical protein
MLGQSIVMVVINIFNKAEAFKKLMKTDVFLAWHKVEVARHLGYLKDIDQIVDEQMELKNLRIETF